jgi:hypothetical protein
MVAGPRLSGAWPSAEVSLQSLNPAGSGRLVANGVLAPSDLRHLATNRPPKRVTFAGCRMRLGC